MYREVNSACRAGSSQKTNASLLRLLSVICSSSSSSGTSARLCQQPASVGSDFTFVRGFVSANRTTRRSLGDTMSDQADTIEVSGRVVRLEVENFKSYRGFQNIGPFKNFTAVVGPNGSGKSNLMDAISFVLGVKTAQLRGSLKELLYSNSAGNTAEDRPRKGLVKLVYESADGAETHFSRIIVPSSSSADATFQSQYKLNSKTVSWDGYNNQLKKYNILVKARNFLVFQVRI